jgi:PAS domain S-box-containing protein
MTTPAAVKSTITCDMEGRLETFNAGAEKVFGYRADEVIGKARVSQFSPGLVVLQNVPVWLKIASVTGKYEGETVFVRKDGSRFPATIRITPTKRDGVQIGYCGVTTPLPMSELTRVEPKIKTFTKVFRWMVVTRAPFLSASIIPVLIAGAYAAQVSAFSWLPFLLALVGAASVHIAANT